MFHGHTSGSADPSLYGWWMESCGILAMMDGIPIYLQHIVRSTVRESSFHALGELTFTSIRPHLQQQQKLSYHVFLLDRALLSESSIFSTPRRFLVYGLRSC